MGQLNLNCLKNQPSNGIFTKHSFLFNLMPYSCVLTIISVKCSFMCSSCRQCVIKSFSRQSSEVSLPFVPSDSSSHIFPSGKQEPTTAFFVVSILKGKEKRKKLSLKIFSRVRQFCLFCTYRMFLKIHPHQCGHYVIETYDRDISKRNYCIHSPENQSYLNNGLKMDLLT